VADADSCALDALLLGGLLSCTVKNNGRCTVLVVQDLNVLQRSSGTLGSHLQTLENSLLCAPLASKACLGAGSLTAVGNLTCGEVALDHGLVLDVDGIDSLNVDARRAVGGGVDLHERLNGVGGVLVGELLLRLQSVGELSGLLVLGHTSGRVQEDGRHLLLLVWRLVLGTEHGVVDETVVVIPVGLLLSSLDLGLVCLELCLIKSGEQVLGVDTDCLSTLLAETERCDGESLDAVGLDASARVDNVVVNELFELTIKFSKRKINVCVPILILRFSYHV
jgi:hypothetical protein